MVNTAFGPAAPVVRAGRVGLASGLAGIVIASTMLGAAALTLRPVAAQAAVAPFEIDQPFTVQNEIDRLVAATLRKKKILPAYLCSDEVFVRRVYLDMIGTVPEPREVLQFLRDARRDKRARLIESLFSRDEFADYGSLLWGDILRVKAEFPINLWPNAVQAYHRWIHEAVRTNMPYDRFARALLTSSGSNFRNPPVNFYRAIQGQEPSAMASAVALTFLGCRVGAWPEARRTGFEAFFSRVAFKKTAEWKEEIVFLEPSATEPLKAVFPDGKAVVIPPGQDPRLVFADWLIQDGNPWFKRAIVNRIWWWLFGRGLIHEPDDIRPDNPPAHPRVLAFLEKELVRSGYDLRHVYRLILNSRTYQQSSIPRSDRPEAEALFACYPVRRLDAEVLIDALCRISGTTERYTSAIPEPFTFIPESNRTIALADGSITSSFLELFGRPTRDSGLASERNNQPSDSQRLHLLNSTHVQRKIERGWKLRQLIQSARGNRRRLVNTIYLAILSRQPTPAERTVADRYFGTRGQNRANATYDLVWALVNSKEFLYRH
jgi:uncharacterized protein DUF1553/uncharacterized protein DUF1549